MPNILPQRNTYTFHHIVGSSWLNEFKHIHHTISCGDADFGIIFIVVIINHVILCRILISFYFIVMVVIKHVSLCEDFDFTSIVAAMNHVYLMQHFKGS